MTANATDQRSRPVFAHDRRDALLVIISLIEMAGKVVLVIYWDTLPLIVTVSSAAVLCLLNCMNFFCAAHYFLHLPFFSRPWLNHVWGVIGSLSAGIPLTLYRAHHLNHHRFVSDHIDVETGDTQDWSSIYRYGRAPNQPEPLWSYALLWPLRDSRVPLVAQARRQHESGQLVAEVTALGLFVILLAAINWRGVIFVYVPIWWIAQTLARVEVYSEHFGATPGDRRTDAVSCYGRWYNLLWFNNGYHQEHHFRPGVHWSGLPALKDQMLPEIERRVVPIAHFTNTMVNRPRKSA